MGKRSTFGLFWGLVRSRRIRSVGWVLIYASIALAANWDGSGDRF